MATSVASVPADHLRTQILDNCSFFSELYARFWLIVSKEPQGDFKAIVVKAVNGNRTAVLSEKAPSYQEALQALLVKSAEAVRTYIAANGFAVLYSPGKQTPKHGGGHDDGDESGTDASSTVTVSECESLSDDETVSVTSVGRLKKRRGRKTDKSAKTASSANAKSRQPRARARSPSVPTVRARSRSSSSSSSNEEFHYNPPTLPSPYHPANGGVGARKWPSPPAPPPPPQPTSAWGNPSSGSGTTPARPLPSYVTHKPPVLPRTSEPMLRPPYPPAPAGYNHNNSPPSNGTNQTGNVVTKTPSISPPRDVILEIRVRDRCRLLLHRMLYITLTGIQSAALAEVRREPNKWIPAPEHGPWSISLARLKATVKAMVLDGTEYGMSREMGNDLTQLVAGLLSKGTTHPPKFVVEVWSETGCTLSLGGSNMTTAPAPLPESTLPAAPSGGPWAVGGPHPTSAPRPMVQPHPPRVDSNFPHVPCW